MTDTPTVFNVGSFTDLNNAIEEIDSGTLPNGQAVNENDVVINFTNSIDATAGNYETVFNTPGDLLALDNPLANVTIEGNGFTYNGDGEVRGFMALDGNVTIDNLVVAGAVAAGGDGGNGLAGGGGGAGLGGAVFVGSNATVTLTNDTFVGNLAVGGDGGGIDPNATASGGGGGLGGVGGSASDADGIFTNAITGYSTTGPGGGGGGGVGSQAGTLFWTVGGSETALGLVYGENRAAGDGAGQAQNIKQEENVLGWDVWSHSYTSYSGVLPGGPQGGQGGPGDSPESGGGGGGVNGQDSQYFNNGTTEVQESPIVEFIFAGLETIGGILVPPLGVAEAATQLSADLYNSISNDDWGPAAIAAIATDVVTVGVGVKGLLSTTEVAVASELAQQETNASKVKGVFAFLSEIKPVLKTGFNIAGFVLDEVLAKDPQDRNLLAASYNFVTQNPDTWTPPPLDGQDIFGVTMQTSTAFQTNEPTAGGAGGWGGGGGGGGGVGGAGGFGGGGGGGGGPSQDQDFVGGNGGFGGGGGGGGINAAAGLGGWGAGDGTDGVYRDPDTGVISPMLGMGGGGLGAGGGVFVESGGKLNIGNDNEFIDDAAQGGVAVNPGLGVGNDVFLQGSSTLNFNDGFVYLQDGLSAQYQLALNISGTGYVQLGGVNSIPGNITLGDSADAANALQIINSGHLAFYVKDNNGEPIALNGGLELLAGVTFSNPLTIIAATGSSLVIDPGADFTGTVNFAGLGGGLPFNLVWTPDLTATTPDGIVPFNITNFDYSFDDVRGFTQSIDLFETPYNGDHYSVLKVDGVLRLASLTSDGHLDVPNGLSVQTTGTELTLVDPNATQYTVHDDNDLLALNDVLGAEGASVPGSYRVDLDPAGTFQNPITLGATPDRETLAIHGPVSGPITFADAAGSNADLAIDQDALTDDPDNAMVAVFEPAIHGFGAGDEIDLTGLAFSSNLAADTASFSNGVLTVSNGFATDQLSLDAYPGTLVLGSDGHGGTEVFTSLSDAILAANAEPSPATGTTDLVILAPDPTQYGSLPAIDLASNVQLTIEAPISGSAAIVVNGAGTVVLDSPPVDRAGGFYNYYTGGTVIDSGRLELAEPVYGAGDPSGAITFGGMGTLAFTSADAPLNQINGFQIGQGILDFEGIGTATSYELGADNSFTLDGQWVGNTYLQGATVQLDPNQDYSKDTFILSADTATNGTFVRVLQTTFTVTDEASLNQAIAAINSGGTDVLPNTAYTIDFDLPQADGHTLKLTSALDAINLQSGTSLTINGLDHGVADTIDGGGTERGLFVYAGTVSIENLTIANAAAQGGAGASGGGGGAGLGGGLFVASGASVTLDDVNFSGNRATGGAGGGSGEGVGGGGGMGGAGGGGDVHALNGSGGGGGIGPDATGANGLTGSNGGPGIVANLPSAAGLSGVNGGGGDIQLGGGVNPAGGSGGFGGGGAGGLSVGGGGGFGGGGGGGAGAIDAEFGETPIGYGGGAGGFGGGGGAGPGAPYIFDGNTITGGAGGLGGFGAGNGGDNHGNGGGGLAAGGDIFVQSGGSLTIAGGTLEAGTVNRSGGSDQGEAYGSGIFLQGDQTITLAPATGDTETISGVIADMSGSVDSTGGTTNGTGAGSLVIGDGTSQGTVVLAPLDAEGNPTANTFTGSITVKSGTLELGSAGAAGTGTIHAIDPTIEYSASGIYANAIELDVGTPATGDPTNFEVDAGVTATISGAISNGSGTNALGETIDPNQPIVKSGSGTLVLSNVNTYTGSTSVTGGALSISSDNNLGTGTLALGDGTTLDLTASFSLAHKVTIAGTATVDVTAGQTVTDSGGITGSTAALVKTDTGTLKLSASDNFAALDVNGGTVLMGSSAALQDKTAVSVATGATLDLGGFETDIGTLAGAGTVTDSGAAATLTINTTNPTTFSGVIEDGVHAVTLGIKNGELTLSGANTYSGATIISKGSLTGGAANAFSANSSVTVFSHTTLDLGGFNQAIALLISNGSSAAVTNSGAAAATLTTGGSGNSTFGGTIADGTQATTGLTKTGAGTLTLAGTDTYSGATTISAGTLQTTSAKALSASSDLTVATGAKLDLDGFSGSVGSLAGGGTVTNNGGASATLTAGGDNASTGFSGTITDGSTHSTGLTKTGTGTLTLSGDSTYTGGTKVTGGSLSISADDNLGNGGTLALGNGTTLDLTASFTLAHAITISGDPTFDVASGKSVTISAAIIDGAQAGEVEKTDGGTLVLSGDNTYSGGTAIEGGTLEIGAGATAGTGAITFESGPATLKFDAAISTTTPLEPTNTITNFAAGDTIDLSGLAYNAADEVSYNGSNQVTVTDGSGDTLAQFAVSGLTPYTSSHLALAPDSTGDMDIVVATDADPAIQQVSGPGTLSLVGETYTLNLGVVYQGENVADTFNIVNNVQGPADSLSGTSSASGDDAFSDTGLGAFGPLSAGGTSPISIDFNPQSPGVFTQTITLAETDSNATGFDESLAGQTVVVTGAAYGPAVPSITSPTTIYVHLGQDGGTATGYFTVSNTAPTNGYAENLIAQVSGFGSYASAASGIVNLAPGASNNTALAVTFSTGTLGTFSGNVAIALQSDGNGVDDHGITSLGTAYVPATIDVDNYASAAIQQASGPATLSQTDSTHYTIDFGTVTAGQGQIADNLDVANAVTGPADWLSGLLSANGDAAFSDTSLGAFSPLGAGDTTPFAIGLDTTDVGSFVQTITVQLTDSNPSGYSATLNDITLTVKGSVVACYVAGTLITTRRGQKKVEKLEIGDEVMTAAGALRPIKWIGTRSYGGRFIMGRKDILPICFKPGSLGDDMPRRDLWISPHHAMYFENEGGGVLIEAKDLVNGVSIVQAEQVEQVEYFHIELDTHDVIVAEGALSETFVDDDSRAMFHNAREYSALYENEEMAPARYYAPRLDHGYEVEAVRQRLARRAGLVPVTVSPGAGALRGCVDLVSATCIAGWAQNIDHAEAAVCLDIVAGGRLIGQVLANRYRDDLARAGLGSGRHSFEFTPPVGLAFTPGAIEVRRSLDGAVVKFSTNAAPLPDQAIGRSKSAGAR